MAIDKQIFRSSVKPALLKYLLFRGTCISAVGIIPLIAGAILMTPANLSFWGLLLFFFSMICITIGLLPYKRLKALERKPNELIISSDGCLHYLMAGKMKLTIPQEMIKKISYHENGHIYGISVLSENKTLFFPYFSETSYKEIQEILNVQCLTE